MEMLAVQQIWRGNKFMAANSCILFLWTVKLLDHWIFLKKESNCELTICPSSLFCCSLFRSVKCHVFYKLHELGVGITSVKLRKTVCDCEVCKDCSWIVMDCASTSTFWTISDWTQVCVFKYFNIYYCVETVLLDNTCFHKLFHKLLEAATSCFLFSKSKVKTWPCSLSAHLYVSLACLWIPVGFHCIFSISE